MATVPWVKTLATRRRLSVESVPILALQATSRSWVEIMPSLDYDLIRTFDRQYPQLVDPTNGEQAELDRLTDDYEQLAELIETGVADDDAEARAEALQIRIDALNGAMQAYTIETMEAGGSHHQSRLLWPRQH